MVGYFGKLPGSADFVSSRATSEDLQAFDECLQGAMLRLTEEAEWEAVFDAMPRCSFLFRASAQHWLAGEFASSRDASGRRYPLMIFQRLPVQVNGQPFYAPWTLCEVQARQANEVLIEAVHGNGKADVFADGVQALRPLIDSDMVLHQKLYARVQDDIRLCDISDAMSGGYPEFIANAVLHRMTGLKQVCTRHGMPPTILPLPAEQALMRPMADIWMRWLSLIAPAPPALVLLVHDFMRPKLLAFSRRETSRLYRVLGKLSTRQEHFDVLEPFEHFDPALAQTDLPNPEQSIGSCMARYTGHDDRSVRHQ